MRKIKKQLYPWKTSIRENRREEIVLSRIRIGHTRLTHLSLITEGNIALCNICNSTLTIEHVVTQCRKYTKERNECLGQQIEVEEILGDSEENIQKLLEFLKKTNLYKQI